MLHWRFPRGFGPTNQDWLVASALLPQAPIASAFSTAVRTPTGVILAESGFPVYCRFIVFSVFLSFLLPIWSLSFATDAIGGEREDRTLAWLFMQPLSRWAIYLAKFVAILPYSLTLNLGGFLLLGVAAGPPGLRAFRLFWPDIALATLAFCSLYHLMGASFRRASIVAIVYSFFLEIILGTMPGRMKRVSLGFYVRCMMYERAEKLGVQPERSSIFLAVDAQTAQWVLIATTLLFLGIGMIVFSRTQYQDLT
jgi:hypothetical protein